MILLTTSKAESCCRKFSGSGLKLSLAESCTGGMIGCSGNPSVIDLYVFDKSSRNTSVSFDYDAKAMTKVYHEWKKHGGNVVGFIHSHPSNFMQPSYDDISMALALMRFFKNNYFYMPIVRAEKHGYFTIYFYILRMNENEITETFEYVIKATDKGYSIIPQNRVTNTYSVKKLEKHYGPDKVAAEREAHCFCRKPRICSCRYGYQAVLLSERVVCAPFRCFS